MLTFKTNVHSFLVAFSLNTNNIFYTSLIKGSNKKNTKYICYWLFLTTSTRLDRSFGFGPNFRSYLFVCLYFIYSPVYLSNNCIFLIWQNGHVCIHGLALEKSPQGAVPFTAPICLHNHHNHGDDDNKTFSILFKQRFQFWRRRKDLKS